MPESPYKTWPLHEIEDRDGRIYPYWPRPKLVLHTTETRGLPNYSWPPHITYDVDNDRGWRHVAPDRSAYALRSPGGGYSPNYAAGLVFQIELISYAGDSPRKSDTWYDRVGCLVADVCRDLSIPAILHPKGFVSSGAYGTSGVNRLTWGEYREFSGILGHQHVPYNTHWDPGNLDENKLEKAIGAHIMATYKGVKNVPENRDGSPKDWAKQVVDWGISDGLIKVNDENPEDWEGNLTDGRYWTFEFRRRGSQG